MAERKGEAVGRGKGGTLAARQSRACFHIGPAGLTRSVRVPLGHQGRWLLRTGSLAPRSGPCRCRPPPVVPPSLCPASFGLSRASPKDAPLIPPRPRRHWLASGGKPVVLHRSSTTSGRGCLTLQLFSTYCPLHHASLTCATGAEYGARDESFVHTRMRTYVNVHARARGGTEQTSYSEAKEGGALLFTFA